MKSDMMFDPGFSITVDSEPMGFRYGGGVYGPEPELRSLDAIRKSLLNPTCSGPKDVYCIAMDVAKEQDRGDLISRNLLYGAVTYAQGKLGAEPVRSQGHVHAVSASCGASTCEVYEIWDGRAVIYMQENSGDDAGDCYAVYGGPGDVIIVPPGWVHATVNADPNANMTFGAWCVRDYGFEYDDVRRHNGIAFFPTINKHGLIAWQANHAYTSGKLIVKKARTYEDFGLDAGLPIYTQYERNRSSFDFVTRPQDFSELWAGYCP